MYLNLQCFSLNSMTFVVSEIGINWDGDYELLKKMIEKSKKAGCDAVKLQAFTEEMVKDFPESERLSKSRVSAKNVEIINDMACSIGIEWFCTPMYPNAVDFLNPFVKRFKIRVSDGRSLFENKETELIRKVLKTGKETIISCENSPNSTILSNNPKVKWLYCVAKYPCTLGDLNFIDLNEYDGFSNHCPNLIAPLTASILGSEIIEMHVTNNKSKNYIDNPVSFDFLDLENIITMIRHAEKIKKVE